MNIDRGYCLPRHISQKFVLCILIFFFGKNCCKYCYPAQEQHFCCSMCLIVTNLLLSMKRLDSGCILLRNHKTFDAKLQTILLFYLATSEIFLDKLLTASVAQHMIFLSAPRILTDCYLKTIQPIPICLGQKAMLLLYRKTIASTI